MHSTPCELAEGNSPTLFEHGRVGAMQFCSYKLSFYKISYLCSMKLIDTNRDRLFELCDSHKVKELYLFGSVLTERFQDSSDIDMLIQFYQVDLMDYFDNYMDLKEKLEQLFNRPVDLVENQAIRNPIFRRVVDREKQLIYERKSA
jgi:predicted nucleotidyltransferase